MNRVVLLVEDNPTDEKLTVRAFAKCAVAHEIMVVRDGVQALDYVFCSGPFADRDLNAAPALVLLDLKLPRVDGLEVLRRIRSHERTRLLPIVVLSASREEEDVVRSYAFGANAYLRKPVDYTEFVTVANAISAFWLRLNEPPPLGRSLP